MGAVCGKTVRGGNRYLSYLPQCNVLICLDVVLLSTQGAKSGSQKNHHTQNKKNTKNKKEQGGVVDRSKGVYVGTAHQSKGLEWKVVFVVGMHDGESFRFFVFLFFVALCIDLVTDKVQPLSREFPNAVAQQRDSGRGLGGGAKVGLCGVQVCGTVFISLF